MQAQYKNVEERQMQAISLAERRRSLGLSQQRVAELVGCSVTRVGQLERAATPAGEVYDRIVRKLDEAAAGVAA